jgi:hypothetical protein
MSIATAGGLQKIKHFPPIERLDVADVLLDFYTQNVEESEI